MAKSRDSAGHRAGPFDVVSLVYDIEVSKVIRPGALSLGKYRGHFTIALMVTIAIAAASWAWWQSFSATRLTMKYFGTQQAACIHRSESLKIVELTTDPQNSSQVDRVSLAHDQTAESITIDNRTFQIKRAWEASQSPGMIHLRHALLQDASYAGPAAEGKTTNWQYCLIFTNGDMTARLAISVDDGNIKRLPDGIVLSIQPAIVGIKEVIDASRAHAADATQ